MVAPENVRFYIKEGKASGFRVGTARFGEAPYYSLVLKDAARYWGMIGRYLEEHLLSSKSLGAKMVPSPKILPKPSLKL